MAVHFKFKAAKTFDSVAIDGHFITVANLKDRIVEQKHLGNATDFDLLITDAETGEDYTDDIFPIRRNTSVIVRRVPATRKENLQLPTDNGKLKPSKQDFGTPQLEKPEDPSAAESSFQDDFGDMYSLSTQSVAASMAEDEEEAKLAAMVKKQSKDWQRQTQEAGRGFGRGSFGGRGAGRGAAGGRFTFSGRSNTPPAGYICHRCGQAGHYIQHCPTNGDSNYDIKRVKPPSGIPRTRLQADEEGSLIAPDGRIVKLRPDEERFEKEADALLHMRPTTVEPPPELRCPLCKQLFRDAVLIPCCQETFCDQCIRDELIKTGKCPQCGSSKFKNDDLMPNKALRQNVDRFKESFVVFSSFEEAAMRSQQAHSPAPPAGSAGTIPAISTDRGSAGSGANTKENATSSTKKTTESGAESQEKTDLNVDTPKSISAPSKSGLVDAVDKSESGVQAPSKQQKGVGSTNQIPIRKEGAVGVGGEIEIAGKSETSKGISTPLEPQSMAVGGDLVAIGPETSKEGTKKKKKHRAPPADLGMEPPPFMYGKVDHPCPKCGLFDHPPWECPEHMMGMDPMGHYPHYPGMFAHGPPNMNMGPVPPGMMPPYGNGNGNGFWGPQMPPMPQYPGPFPPHGMYDGAPPPHMMYDMPMMRPGGGMYGNPGNRPPFPMYPGGPPMQRDYMGPMDMMDHDPRSREHRPYTREEFEEMQLLTRRRIELAERKERRRLRFQQSEYHHENEQPEMEDVDQAFEMEEEMKWAAPMDVRKNISRRVLEGPSDGFGGESSQRISSAKRRGRGEEEPSMGKEGGEGGEGGVGGEVARGTWEGRTSSKSLRQIKRSRLGQGGSGRRSDDDELERYELDTRLSECSPTHNGVYGEKLGRVNDVVFSDKSRKSRDSSSLHRKMDGGDEFEDGGGWIRNERMKNRKSSGKDKKVSEMKYEVDDETDKNNINSNNMTGRKKKKSLEPSHGDWDGDEIAHEKVDKYGNVGDRYGNVGDRYGNVGDRYGNVGEKYGNLGEKYGNLGEKYGNTGEKYGTMGSEEEEEMVGKSNKSKKKTKALSEEFSDDGVPSKTKRRHKKHRDVSSKEVSQKGKLKKSKGKGRGEEGKDSDLDARWPMDFEANGVELIRSGKHK